MSSHIETIILTDAESESDVYGTLHYDPTYQELSDLDDFWRPYVHFAIPELSMRGASLTAVPDYVNWNWAAKMALAKRASWRFFCIRYKDRAQGAIVVSTTAALCQAPEHAGAQAIGIEFLATAPWNIGRFLRPLKREPFLDLIGATLLRVAISLSQATPRCDGRVYLYSVPKAESFYRRIWV